MNRRAAVKATRVETNHNRKCSFALGADGSVILHSARLRNTVFLPPRKARGFLAKWHGTNSDEAHNTLVESFFE
jgi:hypothetical protein